MKKDHKSFFYISSSKSFIYVEIKNNKGVHLSIEVKQKKYVSPKLPLLGKGGKPCRVMKIIKDPCTRRTY
jgi:hypothetical protein